MELNREGWKTNIIKKGRMENEYNLKGKDGKRMELKREGWKTNGIKKGRMENKWN